ncbi:hypothetical protein HDV64DRAFT_279873 [Trichoderma sp. TUCIM 5745]
MKESIHTHFIITSLLLLFNLLSIALAQHAVPTATATVSRDMRASQTAAVSLGKSSTTEEPKTGIIDKAISSHDQSTTCELTATRTTHEETSIPASTLTSTSTSTAAYASSFFGIVNFVICKDIVSYFFFSAQVKYISVK